MGVLPAAPLSGTIVLSAGFSISIGLVSSRFAVDISTLIDVVELVSEVSGAVASGSGANLAAMSIASAAHSAVPPPTASPLFVFIVIRSPFPFMSVLCCYLHFTISGKIYPVKKTVFYGNDKTFSFSCGYSSEFRCVFGLHT